MLASVTTTTTPGSHVEPSSLGIGARHAARHRLHGHQPADRRGRTDPAIVTGNNFAPGIYCVRVFDVGNLTVPVNFAVRIVHT